MVSACAPEALEHGVFPGLPLAEAQTLLQHTAEREWRFEPADPEADLIALRALAGMCQTFGSLVALETDAPPSSLLIDVSGCASHFGGERGLLRAVTEEFGSLGLNIRTALAESFGGAWGVAHFGSQSTAIIPRGRLREALHPLPLAALRLPAKVIQAFAELDVLSVVQLERIPRDSLVARFGNEVLLRIDQAFGAAPELLAAEHAALIFEVEWDFDEPVTDAQMVTVALRELLADLTGQLHRQRRGVLELIVHWRGGGRERARTEIGTRRPECVADRLWELLQLKLETLRWEGEVSQIKLRATRTAPLVFGQQELFEDERTRHRGQRLDGLIEQLANRLGRQAVVRPRLHPDAQPEHAHRGEPLLEKGPPARKPPSLKPCTRELGVHRPLRLKPQPSRLEARTSRADGVPMRVIWNGCEHTVVRSWGPERIETGWWRPKSIERDYFRIELDSGEHLWVFLQAGAWFLHGLFE